MHAWADSRHRRRLVNEQTYKGYRTHVNSLVGHVGEDRPVGDITPADLDDWVTDLADRLRPTSVGTYVRTAKRFFSWAEREGLVRRSPAADIEVPRVPKRAPRILRPATISDVMYRADFRERVQILLLLGSGLRVGELAGLDARDYDPEQGTVHVRHGKGDRDRTVVLTVEADRAVRTWLDGRRTGPMWPSPYRGSGLSAKTISRRLSELIGDTPDGEGSTAHAMRHTSATAAADAGMPLHVLRDRLGHENLATTGMYLWSSVDDQRRHLGPGHTFDQPPQPPGGEGRGEGTAPVRHHVQPLAPILNLGDWRRDP